MAMDERQRRQWDRFREKMGADRVYKEQCAGLCRQYWPDDCDRTMKTADDLLEHTFLFQLPWDMEQTQEPVHFEEGIEWNYILHEDPEFAYQMNRHRYWICLGQAYGLTGDERYAGEVVYQLLDWLDKVPWTQESAGLTWRTLEAGLRADYWVRAMALCADSPAVTEEAAERFLEGLKVHGQRLFENPNIGFSRKSNWGVMEYAGLYVIGFILENEEYVERASQYLRRGLHIQVMDDGMHWEMSPMYHNEVLMAYLEVMRIGKIWNHKPFSDKETEIIRKMAYGTMGLKTPAGRQPMTGDSDDTDVRDLLSQTGLVMRDGRLKAGGFERLDYESIWLFGPEGFKAYETIETETAEAGIMEFPDSGQVVMRDGWGDNAGWLYFVNGPLGGGHGHLDKLHVGLWIGGEEILTDSGRYTYKDVDRRYELKAARAHNVPMVGDLEYSGSKDTWTYDSLPQCFPNQVCRKGEYLFIEGAHGGYGARGIVVRRRIVAVGFDIFAVSDTFLGNMPEEITQTFHFGESIRLTRTAPWMEGTGEKVSFVIRAFAEGEEAVMKAGTAALSRHYNQLGEAAKLRVTGRDVRTLTTFLVQTRSDGKTDIAREDVLSFASGQRLQVQDGEGYVITAGSRKVGLVFLHHEVGNGTDYNGIRGVYGLGRTMVCDLNRAQEDMTVLQW